MEYEDKVDFLDKRVSNIQIVRYSCFHKICRFCRDISEARSFQCANIYLVLLVKNNYQNSKMIWTVIINDVMR